MSVPTGSGPAGRIDVAIGQGEPVHGGAAIELVFSVPIAGDRAEALNDAVRAGANAMYASLSAAFPDDTINGDLTYVGEWASDDFHPWP